MNKDIVIFKIVLLTLFLTANVVSAQNGFSIEKVTLFDGEKVLENVNIKVVDEFITEISTEKFLDVANVIDGKGKFLMPGMTNCHVHVWSQLALTEAARAGVLNVLDMHGIELYQGPMKALNDSTTNASYYMAGAAATAPNGHGTQFGFPTPTLSTPEEAEKFVSDRILAGADYIKIIIEPWKATLDEMTVKALIDETHDKNRLAVAHISRAVDAQMAVKNNIDGLVHLWRDTLLNSTIINNLAKTHDFFVIPTILTNVLANESIKKKAPENQLLSKEQILKEVKKLYDSGVPILTGTDPPNLNINYGTDLYKEMKLMAEAGLTS